MVKFLRYHQSKALRERIETLYKYHQKTPTQIAEIVERSVTTVCYHLRALGIIIRHKPRRDLTYCMVCDSTPKKGKNPVDPVLKLVCRDPECHGSQLYIETFMVCQMRQEDAEIYILTKIPPKYHSRIPLDTAAVCFMDHVHRVFVDYVDHLKYHIYRWHKQTGHPTSRPPSPLYVSEDDMRLYIERKKEADYVRRNMHSETPQPRRIR